MSVAVPWKCIVLGASNELVAPYEYAWTSVHVGFRASCAVRAGGGARSCATRAPLSTLAGANTRQK